MGIKNNNKFINENVWIHKSLWKFIRNLWNTIYLFPKYTSRKLIFVGIGDIVEKISFLGK